MKPEYGPTLGRLLAPRWHAATRRVRIAVLMAGVNSDAPKRLFSDDVVDRADEISPEEPEPVDSGWAADRRRRRTGTPLARRTAG